MQEHAMDARGTSGADQAQRSGEPAPATLDQPRRADASPPTAPAVGPDGAGESPGPASPVGSAVGRVQEDGPVESPPTEVLATPRPRPTPDQALAAMWSAMQLLRRHL